MIYLHHVSLNEILSEYCRLTKFERESIHHYRLDILTKFCKNHDLPKPVIERDKNGKPFIKNSHLSFNHSHCQSDYALIYSLNVSNIGVDIENINRKLNFELLAKRFFHADEYHLWQKNQDKQTWFKLWTIKEAALKAHGLGIRMPLNELNAVFEGDDFGCVCHDKIGRFYFKSLMINDCVVTVAYPDKMGKVAILPDDYS